jgi:hypothetical protein
MHALTYFKGKGTSLYCDTIRILLSISTETKDSLLLNLSDDLLRERLCVLVLLQLEEGVNEALVKELHGILSVHYLPD